MMKVYIVDKCGLFDNSHELVEVFSTEEKAKKFCDGKANDKRYFYDYYEYEVK